MSNNRGRTHRRSPPIDVSGAFTNQASNSAFMKFLDNKTEDAYTRPWHRLERGLRLNRLRMFSKDEADKFHLEEKDNVALLSLLTKALDKKLLNSKTTVVYDQEQQKILEIKGLSLHTLAAGAVQFQFNERKPIGTLKKKRDDDVSSS
jgi:hypothetical protein